LYNESFVNAFRQSAELKYRLMPYVYAQSKECCEKGLPMVRALFVEFPHDAGSWLIEDEYLFGSQILVFLYDGIGVRTKCYLPQVNGSIIKPERYKRRWHNIKSALLSYYFGSRWFGLHIFC
jgi:alpha-D-xyloside xylohydrolase